MSGGLQRSKGGRLEINPGWRDASAERGLAEVRAGGFLYRAGGKWHVFGGVEPLRAACGAMIDEDGETRERWALNRLPPADELCGRCFPQDVREAGFKMDDSTFSRVYERKP